VCVSLNPHLFFINVSLYPKLRYDPLRDFTPISLTHVTPRVLVVHPSLLARSVAELIVLARSRPGELSFGSAGNGSSSHLSGELFAAMTGIKLLHVPYKGSGPASTDLLGGRLSMSFDSIAVYADHIKAGKVRALAVTSLKRSELLPNVPTIAESGFPQYEVNGWNGLLAPAGVPSPIVNRIQSELAKALKQAEVRERMAQIGIEPSGLAGAELVRLMQADYALWSRAIKFSGIQPQ
jgi:tripartite-type tricarboxylate transporter receptor subunit TctC